MFLKILVTVLLAVLVWTVATRLTGPSRPKRISRTEKSNNVSKMAKCPDCGIYLPAGQTCDCSGTG